MRVATSQEVLKRNRTVDRAGRNGVCPVEKLSILQLQGLQLNKYETLNESMCYGI